MKRKLRPGLVVTVTALAACAEPKGRKTTTSAEQGKSVERIDFTKVIYLNPRDAKNRTIYADGARCVVHVPFDEPQHSWQPPKTKAVDCPPSMDDPAWDQCPGGELVKSKEDGRCICSRDGNPPPPPREVTCPK